MTLIYPVVPNPYTLLSLSPSSTNHFTVLDLKDAFFTTPLHPESKDLFAFIWTDPDNHCSQQLTWTVLPQGFCDSPHFFGQALASDLTSFDLTPNTVLQYVDDLLLCSPLLTHSQQHTIQLPNFLANQAYRVSSTKFHLSVPRVTHLRVLLTPTKDILLLIESPLYSPYHSLHQNRDLILLGVSWIPKFAFLVQPLFHTTLGGLSEPLELKSNICSAFSTLKQAILSAPALALPDLSHPFIFHTTERHKIALGVLGQNQGPSFTPVTYLFIKAIRSHTLRTASLPPCSVATALLAQESKNLLLEHPLSFIHHMTLRAYFLTYP